MKINEIFYSIQGEGVLMGFPMVFIRTSGCNLRCKWCDTKYAYDEGEEMGLKEILEMVETFPTKHVCLTGGEPLTQNDIQKLITMLLNLNYDVSLETNGSKSIKDLPKYDSLMINLDIKCPSSEMNDKMDFTNIQLLEPKDQLKFIIEDENDYEYAKDIISKYEPNCNIIVMPVYGSNLKDLAEWVLKDGLNVRVLPQLHKLIWGEKRGV
jgi:7-carboxy-7-deazaguanine synthase